MNFPVIYESLMLIRRLIYTWNRWGVYDEKSSGTLTPDVCDMSSCTPVFFLLFLFFNSRIKNVRCYIVIKQGRVIDRLFKHFNYIHTKHKQIIKTYSTKKERSDLPYWLNRVIWVEHINRNAWHFSFFNLIVTSRHVRGSNSCHKCVCPSGLNCHSRRRCPFWGSK